MRNTIIFLFIAIFSLASCKEYLDIVPDDTESLESLYETRENAWNGLAKIYSYMPQYADTDVSPWMLGDEYLGKKVWEIDNNRYHAIQIMRGRQNESDPILGYWSGTNGGQKLYEGIRQCNIFLEYIHLPANMLDKEKEEWSAQAKFLKAYYHFLLIQRYGPVIIRDATLSLDASKEELYQQRSNIEESFKYVINTMNEAIPKLREQAVGEDAGQIDQLGAKAIKARVLLFEASPFFNGNRDYYSTFKDHNDQHYFPQTEDREKWKAVIDACDEALALCTDYNKGLFRFVGEPYRFDREFFDTNPERMRTLYDLRMLLPTAWNRELLWGYTFLPFNTGQGIGGGANVLHGRTQVKFWEVMRTVLGANVGYSGDGDVDNFANQHLGATLAVAERYYTENGLPIEEDTKFRLWENKYSQAVTPVKPVDSEGNVDPGNPEYAEYAHWAGYMQEDMETVSLYMNREPRFYANLGVTGGYWRGHYFLINFNPYASSSSSYMLARDGKPSIYPFGGRESWRRADDYLETCIGIQKFVHPESYSGTERRPQRYPYPIIRYADLLLMKAEAMNEYYGPSDEVYSLLNEVRARAGIPNVEKSWEVGGFALNPGKHTTQEGLREIILQERGIELAFEGSRFTDMIRHKRAPKEFSKPVYGWNSQAGDSGDQFGSGPQVKQIRSFTITDCLWPIATSELNIQGTLKQNPGWK
ncbi:MAG: RagB/SusD family nutrient uptake outer membrane protein [Bacteroidales bacterium]|jgi:hypothetical protein|nr:RagB/SusD family nutrient uptake outer membrane protein [Bacteroidales bacterium]